MKDTHVAKHGQRFFVGGVGFLDFQCGPGPIRVVVAPIGTLGKPHSRERNMVFGWFYDPSDENNKMTREGAASVLQQQYPYMLCDYRFEQMKLGRNGDAAYEAATDSREILFGEVNQKFHIARYAQA